MAGREAGEIESIRPFVLVANWVNSAWFFILMILIHLVFSLIVGCFLLSSTEHSVLIRPDVHAAGVLISIEGITSIDLLEVVESHGGTLRVESRIGERAKDPIRIPG